MIYLASPYSDPDPAVREQRFEAACAVTAVMLRAGLGGVRRQRQHADCVRADGTQRLPDGTRSAVLRCHRPAVGKPDREEGGAYGTNTMPILLPTTPVGKWRFP